MSSNGRITLIYGYNLSMKMFVSKSKANSRRKYWKCKYWGKEEECQLFHWDGELFGQCERETTLNEGETI